jgi:hypothetical protein
MDTQPTPSSQPGSPEHGTGQQPEQIAGQMEHPPLPAQPAPTGPPAAQPPVQLPTDNTAAGATTPVPSTTSAGQAGPDLANDVDVIEPEWVDKAEQVVRAHAGDPYQEEEAIEDLQQDYLKKRYGYSVGDPKQDTTKSEGA